MIDLTKLSKSDREYAMHIHAIANGALDGNFINSGPNKAIIVLSTIFDTAKKEVRIFADSLTSEVAQSEIYINALIGFFAKGGMVKVLVQKNKLNENSFLNEVFKQFKKQTTIKVANTSLKDSNTGTELHFTVGDDCIYRLEKDITEFKAFGSFNDKTFSKNLITHFEQIFHNPQSSILDIS